MAEQTEGNGRVTLAVLGEKVDNLSGLVEKLDRRIEPYIAQCQRHEDMAKQHITELYDADGHSRLYAMQLQLKSLEDNTRAYMKQAEESIKTTITRRWAVIMVCVASIIGLTVQMVGRWLWP